MADKKIRLGFTRDELRGFYQLAGAEIGRLQAIGILEDKAASEISTDIRLLVALQDRIFTALKELETSKE